MIGKNPFQQKKLTFCITNKIYQLIQGCLFFIHPLGILYTAHVHRELCHVWLENSSLFVSSGFITRIVTSYQTSNSYEIIASSNP